VARCLPALAARKKVGCSTQKRAEFMRSSRERRARNQWEEKKGGQGKGGGDFSENPFPSRTAKNKKQSRPGESSHGINFT